MMLLLNQWHSAYGPIAEIWNEIIQIRFHAVDMLESGQEYRLRGLTKIGHVLEDKQLPLSLVSRDSGIQEVLKFVKAFVGCCRGHFHEAVHDGFPSVIIDEAFDS